MMPPYSRSKNDKQLWGITMGKLFSFSSRGGGVATKKKENMESTVGSAVFDCPQVEGIEAHIQQLKINRQKALMAYRLEQSVQLILSKPLTLARLENGKRANYSVRSSASKNLFACALFMQADEVKKWQVFDAHGAPVFLFLTRSELFNLAQNYEQTKSALKNEEDTKKKEIATLSTQQEVEGYDLSSPFWHEPKIDIGVPQ